MVTRRLRAVTVKQSITTRPARAGAAPFQRRAKTLKCSLMTHRILSLPVLVLLAVLTASAHADGRWRDLPPEERRELREEMREQWRQKKREREQERPQREHAAHGDGLSPEERRRLRDEMREQQRQYPERGGRSYRH
jgi:uncharacterized membrane protein